MAVTVSAIFLKFRIEIIEKTGLYVTDSSPLCVCENIRIPGHKVFREPAQRGKLPSAGFTGSGALIAYYPTKPKMRGVDIQLAIITA